MHPPVKNVTVRINGLKLKAIIGTNAWERKLKQKILINIYYVYDAASAIANDDLSKAINYKNVEEKIVNAVSGAHYFLIETLADEILSLVMQEELVREAGVRVDKPGALRFAKFVSVERFRKKDLVHC